MKLIRSSAKFAVSFVLPALIFSFIIGFLPAGRTFSFLTAQALSAEITTAGPELADQVPGTSASSVSSESGMIFVDKDETVYASLDSSGVVKNLTVVNLMRSTESFGMTEFIDYAVYSRIVSLSDNVEPAVYGDKVSFMLPEAADTFYYRGDPVNRELPFIFDIRYSLDGVETDPKAMAGRSGKVSISLNASPNPKSNNSYLDYYMCQIQVPLSLNVFRNIASTGGQAVIAGSSATYSFTVLPGQTGSFEITADAALFETASASIVCIPFSLTEFAGPDFNVSPDDLKALLDGADRLADGAVELGTGIGKLCDSLNLLSSSAAGLAAGQTELVTGFSQFLDGIEALSTGIGQFSQGLSATAAGGTDLNAGFDTLHNNLTLFLSQLTPLTAALPADQQAAFQYQVAAVEDGLVIFSDSLAQFTNAVNVMSQASAEISTGMQASVAGGQSIGSGLDSLAEGTASFSTGLGRLSSGAAGLKKGALEIADGQSTLASRLRSSLGVFETLLIPAGSSQPVSFANPDVSVRSIQFIISTPEIRIAAAEPAPELPEPEASIWQKFLNLFEGIFTK
ncbi:MAG: hypothetical protein ACYCYM_03410 [Saccharofermentanales bacterium]